MNDNIFLKLLSRKKSFFKEDFKSKEKKISSIIKKSKIIVIGGAGSIGHGVVELLLKYDPKLIHIIDINENKLVELVRHIRSTIGYTKGVFETFPLDAGSKHFEKLVKKNKGYDIWMNFSALKHVRSEKDPFTLMRMIEVNVLNTYKMLELAKKTSAKRFFSVSTDKACDPVNFLGATKRLMELILSFYSDKIQTSSARFGNVAFSEGSLLHSATIRIKNSQPLVAPIDIKRYFITHEEASKLSIIATFCSKKNEILVPKIKKSQAQKDFPSIIKNLLHYKGYEMLITKSEEQARKLSKSILIGSKWPCYLFTTDTAGEKEEEEFIGKEDRIKKTQYKEIEVIDMNGIFKKNDMKIFLDNITFLEKKKLTIEKIKEFLSLTIKNFKHKNSKKSLEEKM